MLEHLFEVLDLIAHAIRFVASFSGASLILLLFTGFYIVHQIYLHPLSHIPGPRLAALTSFYKAYYIHYGDISGHTTALHERYGNAVRIAPNELSFASVESTKKIYGMSTTTSLIPSS
jgi:hypothetical protein